MNTIDELFKEFKQITHKLNDKQQYEALDILFTAYDVHKKEYGSFAMLSGDVYNTKMRERRQYQLNRVKDYVRRTIK